MKNSNILIVEDEQIIAENLRLIINEFGYTSVDVAMDAEETQTLFSQKKYDLVLMDINLGAFSKIDGIDLIQILNKKHSFIHIYVTANADLKTVQKAKQTEPTGYIVKPFINSAIYANVEIALSQIKKDPSLLYKDKGFQYEIKLSEIQYIESDGVYLNVHTNKTHLIRKSLSEVLDLFPNKLIRIHKSIIVNKDHIESCTRSFVVINNTKLNVGRAYRQDLKDLIK